MLAIPPTALAPDKDQPMVGSQYDVSQWRAIFREGERWMGARDGDDAVRGEVASGI